MIHKRLIKPEVVYNNIPDQVKTAANSLTIGDWNKGVNLLKEQANINARHLENLYQVLFGNTYNTDERYQGFVDAYETGLLTTLLNTLRQAQEVEQLHVGPEPPPALTTVLWVDTSEG